jgi:hypothetical protein
MDLPFGIGSSDFCELRRGQPHEVFQLKSGFGQSISIRCNEVQVQVDIGIEVWSCGGALVGLTFEIGCDRGSPVDS